MKVVQINCVYGTASTGRIVKGIETCARENGMECIAAYSQGIAEDSQAFRFGTAFEQKIHALLSRITGLQGYFSHFGTRQLLNKLKEYQPDVVHLHNLHSNNINLKMLLSYLAKKDIATVITLHDCWFFTGKCCHFTIAQCERWRTSCGSCPNLKEDNKSYFFDRSAKMLRDKKRWFERIPRLAVVGVSDWVRNLAQESAVLKNAAIFQTIHNGIDLNVFRPRQSELKKQLGLEGQFVALGLAMGMSKRKGYDDFIKLSDILPQEVTLVLAGLTKEQIENLPEGIVGLERTNDTNQLAEMYSMADVFLNPTYEDTFPLVNIEALACGTPLIAYRTGGCIELINDTCGLLVDCGDVDGMKNALIRFQKERPEIQSCIERASSFWQREQYQDYINLYKEMAVEQ